MKTDPYIRTKGERAGEADLSLKSNLVHIGLIKVDGKQVYPTASQAPVTDDDVPTEGTGQSGFSDETPTPEPVPRSDEHTSELQSLMRISYAVFCLKKKTTTTGPSLRLPIKNTRVTNITQ